MSIATIPRTRLSDVLRAERVKLGSIRSTRWAAALAVLLSAGFVGLMAVGLSAAESEEAISLEEMILATFGPTPTLGAIGYALLFAPALIGLFGALVVSTERGTGLIGMTVAAVPDRRLVLAGKLVASAVISTALGVLVIGASFAIAEPAFVAHGFPATRFDATTAQVLGGGVLYLGLIGTLSTAVAFLFRNTAAAIGAVLVLILVLPGIIQLVPVIGGVVSGILPTALGARMFMPSSDWMSPALGLVGMLGWTVAASAAAVVTFTRSDVR